METDISKNVKWKLKKVNKFWFLDIGGKLKWLSMLDEAIEVFMEENIIFADDIMYQVSEENDGEVIITEVKSIIQKEKTLDVKKDNTVFQTEKYINPDARDDLGKILGMQFEGDLDQDIALENIAEQMVTDTRSNANWRLRKVKTIWFLDIAGKMKRLKMLENVIEVVLEENIIFADEVMYQIIEENGEVVISEVENIDHKNITSESQQNDTIIHMHSDKDSIQNVALMTENREHNEEMRDCSDSVKENDGKDHTLDDEQEENYGIGSDVFLQKKDSVKENGGKDHTLDDEQEEYYDIGSDVYLQKKDSVIENDGKDHTLDDEQEENYDIGSDIYLKKKGKVWRFIDRIKQIKKKKPGQRKTEEPSLEAAPNYLNDSLRDDLSVSSVSDKKKVTAMFDFEKLSEEEISFEMFDELTILEDIVSENPAWCYAEHLLTGEKGFVPIPFITQADHNLIAQDWWHNINRDGAIELLTNLHRPTPGTYLLRRSGSNSFYALSMIVPATYNNSQRIAHYAIRSRQGRLYISQKKQFSDLFDLVDHYKREADGLRCKLVIPAPRQKPIVYPRSIEVQRKSIEIIKSIKIGKFGLLYEGKLCNIFDVTIVTECKSEVERFLAEANHLNKFLHSKHLVRVIAVVLEPKPFMIVLGETVQDTLQYYLEKCDQKTISFKRLTNIAAEIAKGMAFLEDNGIVHGNLKTENVLICENDKLKLLHPKLIKLMRTSDNDEHKEGETEWQWTAPEVVADESVLCTKSDVWSFGVVMYEIITFGGVPYAGLEKEETLQRLLKGYFRQPIPAQCPDEFYSTILQCWHQIPDCRLTFSFLYNYLDDFENASESEKFLKDYKLKLINPHIYKKGTLKIETGEQTRGKLKTEKSLAKELDDPDEYALVNIKTDTDIDQTASNKDVDITPGFDGTPLDDFTADTHIDQTPSNKNVGITPGFDATAFNDYTAEDDNEISFDQGDIITNIDPIDIGWWIGTTANGERGKFPAHYVRVCVKHTHIDQTASNKDVDITPGFEGKPLNDYTADLHDDQSTRNRSVDITPGFDVTTLRGFTAETDDQISFDPGDIITNIEPINDDWWKGKTAKGIRGLFPATYVEVREITYAEVKNQNNVKKIIERMKLK